MEYNGLTFKHFDKCLKEIEDLTLLNEKVAHLVYDYSKRHDDYCEFYYPTSIDMLVSLLKIILDDRNDWIGYWCFEREFGKREIGAVVTGEDGTVYPLENTEHLWNILAAERRERGDS